MHVYVQNQCKRLSRNLSSNPSVRVSRGGIYWKVYHDITLVDGSVPVIENHESAITGLEPAVWFKVLLIDSVCIDIENEAISWTTCSRTTCHQRSMSYHIEVDQPFARCNHTHECLLNEEFFLPDVDLKKGLEIATRILNEKQESQQDLLHLLHVYILPIIRLHADDKDHVSVALQNQKQVLTDLDNKLDNMTVQRGRIKEVMRQWRGDICNMLQTDKDIAGCNKDFLKVLCQHLNDDIQNAYVQLDRCQQAVDLAKTRVEKKEGNNYITQLTRARSTRDEVAQYIQKALYVVEEVSLMFDVVRRPASVEMSDMQLGYIQINKEWESHTQELRELQRKKVCATSVREALVNTKTELEHTKDTLGIDLISSGTAKATDVLDPEDALPKEWEQLQKHVREALETQEHLREPHVKFCHHLRSSCVNEIAECKMLQHRERVPSFTQTTKLLIEQHLKPKSEPLRALRASLKERKPSTHFQGMAKMLLKETQEHFTKMVNLMVHDFSVPSNCSARLWTCYERCIFPVVNTDIMKIYKESYKKEVGNLKSYLPSVSITDLGLDDEWILNILGLYAPNGLTGFMTDEPGSHRNSVEDAEPSSPVIGSVNCTEPSSPVIGSVNCTECDCDNANIASSQTDSVLTCDSECASSNSSMYNPHRTSAIEETCGNRHSDELTDKVKANLERFEQLQLNNDLERPDFELSTRSEPPPSPSVKRRTKKNSSDAALTRRRTKVIDTRWVTPPPRSKSYSGIIRPKSPPKQLPASLPTMLDAEVRMSSVIGPTSLPIDIPVQKGSDEMYAFADSGVSMSSHSADADIASYRNSTENKNNSRHMNDEGLSPCGISIMVSTPAEPSTTSDVPDELSKRRNDPYVAAFLDRFRTAYYCFKVVLQESVPTSKFQWLCKCLKEVNDVAEKQAQLIFCGKKRMLCGDDLLTTLILFILHGEPEEMAQAYPQMKFMEDYLPEFLDKGQFGFSVYQFMFAFQYILDKQEATRRLNEECNEHR